MLVIVALCATAIAGVADKEAALVMGYSNQVFYNVDPRDAIALIRSWMRMIDRKRGSRSETSVVQYKTFMDMEDAVRDPIAEISALIDVGLLTGGLIAATAADASKGKEKK